MNYSDDADFFSPENLLEQLWGDTVYRSNHSKCFRIEKKKCKLTVIPPVKFNLRDECWKNENSQESISKKICMFVDII